MSIEQDKADKAEKSKQSLRESLALKSKELLEVELFEKTLYADALLATYNSMETQHRRMGSEKARLDRDLTDGRRLNNVLREQHDMMVEVVKLLVGVKPAANLAFTAAQTVVNQAFDSSAVSFLDAANLLERIFEKSPKLKTKPKKR